MCVCVGGEGGEGRGEGMGGERRRGRISAHSGHFSQDTQNQISILQATKTTGGKEGPGTWLTSVALTELCSGKH